MAGIAAVAALAASATMGLAAAAVLAAGLALSAAYSLRPLRLSDRGALASLLLPFGYVAVPSSGLLAVRPHVAASDLLLVAGLYIGFIGRILLKDFRDVRGDALFGKRTFLVRHGRRWTCICMTDAGWSAPAGAAVLAAITAIVLGQAAAMAQRGPLSRLGVPTEWFRPNRRENGCAQRQLLPTEPC